MGFTTPEPDPIGDPWMNPRDPFDPNSVNPPSQTPGWGSQPASSWHTPPTSGSPWTPPASTSTDPNAPWARASTVTPPAYQSSAPAVQPAPAAPSHSSRRPALGAVVGSALLAAVLASGSTFAVVELAAPHNQPAASPAAANANVTSQAPAASTGTSVSQEDITGVVASVKDSVLTLTSTIATNSGGGGRFGFPFGGGGGGTATGIGSGIILTSDGYVLTNRHVVEGSQSLKATLADGTEYSATVVKISDTEDLALVKVDATGLKPAAIGDSNGIQVGQTAIAIGSPLGTFTDTVTKGIVSALDRTITVQDEETGKPVTLSHLIQTDAAINPGNSGGPLMNAAGQVVGVNTATAGQAEGIGFAIPINEAQSLIDQAKTASVA
jgi:S1-C subfamily serine protease